MLNSPGSPDMIDQKIGRKMRQLRISCGLTQKEVAAMLGVSFQQIQKYEKGLNRMNVPMLYIFCRSLDISFKEVLETVWSDELDKEDTKCEAITRSLGQLTKHQRNVVTHIVAAFQCINSNGKRRIKR